LNGNCHSPIAALATPSGKSISFRVAVGARDGHPPVIRAEAEVDSADTQLALDRTLKALEQQGVREMLGT
jgi:porphobilinogen deaminase